ncbi:marine proteobacterial sortase target protein [Hellea balneolensis]|uniref:marine proteobacterial sortase target protein n=1 Tax=Hellea balneolensis TaxID=287478 RepID=UPI0006854128|nr:marine proteobacterial sortase target protein [Hellea balneolensis]
MRLIHTSLITTAIFLVVFSTSARADTPPPPNPASAAMNTEIGINEVSNGSLLFKTDRLNRYLKAPMVSTDVKMKIAGPVIRTTLSQTFQNTSDEWVEGVYVFPLPENAAVDRLRIVVGGRFIEGQIKEKKQAKKIYETAKAQGKKASLVEQLRPNMFSASVANIGPQEAVAIQIEYQDKSVIKQGFASLIFPMTVAPRFSPPSEVIKLATADGGTMPVVLDPVLDRHLISPPVMDPKDEPTEYLRLPVSIDIELDAGFDVAEIDSPYHDISVNRIDGDSAHITLAAGDVPANRDFQLKWRAQASHEPQRAVFKETIGETSYLMTMMSPPLPETPILLKSHAREMLFIIDTSGSMGGTSIAQARRALKLGLNRLGPEDSFNVTRFSGDYSKFSDRPLPATEENIQRALRYVERLTANGGTMMRPALSDSFKTKSDEERLRQIVFITDGAIGNETELFALIQDKLGDARMFPVGIGSAPNRFFMSRAAKFGRGTMVMIGKIDEVETQMGELFAALENPVLTNLQLSLKDKGEAYPSRLPDLYDGEPVVSIVKLASHDIPKSLTISGQYSDSPYKGRVDLTQAIPAKGLSVLWARQKIADLEERRFDRQGAAEIDAKILKTALDHHLVSRLTSLVAVDVTPSRDMSNPLQTLKVPTQLPAGWDFAKLASNNTASHRASSAANTQAAPAPRRTAPMPSTASPHSLMVLLGLMLMLFGILTRRRRHV